MDRKYKIDNQFLFVPKKNTLSPINGSHEDIILGTNESRLLSYLIENRHRTMTRKELISALWGTRDIYVEDSSLTQSVSTLRRALNDSIKLPVFIKTVPKLGYEFIASTEELSKPNLATQSEQPIYIHRAETKPEGQSSGVLLPQHLLMHSLLLRFEVYILAVILVFIVGTVY